jgi:hypothetical protein
MGRCQVAALVLVASVVDKMVALHLSGSPLDHRLKTP